jgi:hypothetical protein
VSAGVVTVTLLLCPDCELALRLGRAPALQERERGAPAAGLLELCLSLRAELAVRSGSGATRATGSSRPPGLTRRRRAGVGARAALYSSVWATARRSTNENDLSKSVRDSFDR